LATPHTFGNSLEQRSDELAKILLLFRQRHLQQSFKQFLVTFRQRLPDRFLPVHRGQAIVRIDVGGRVFQARKIRQPGEIPR